MQHPTVAAAALIVLVTWRVVARVRRLVFRQPLKLWRQRATVLVFPVLVGLLTLGALGDTEALLALLAGSVAGGGLAVVGVRRTRFEITGEGSVFYTPCAPIGIGLALMLVARIAYRALEWVEAKSSAMPTGEFLVLTPTTLFVFATLAGYYSAYAFGLLRWHGRRVARAAA